MDNIFDELLQECKNKKRDDEEICYAIGAGRIIPKIGKKKQMEEALDFIKNLEGFCGVNPIDLWHTLIIFDTLNNAKGAHNLMKSKGIQIGTYIVPILVRKEFLNRRDNNG